MDRREPVSSHRKVKNRSKPKRGGGSGSVNRDAKGSGAGQSSSLPPKAEGVMENGPSREKKDSDDKKVAQADPPTSVGPPISPNDKRKLKVTSAISDPGQEVLHPNEGEVNTAGEEEQEWKFVASATTVPLLHRVMDATDTFGPLKNIASDLYFFLTGAKSKPTKANQQAIESLAHRVEALSANLCVPVSKGDSEELIRRKRLEQELRMVHLKFEALVLQWTFEEVLSDKFQIDLGGVVDDTRDVITSYQVEEGPDKTQATMPPALEVGDEELGLGSLGTVVLKGLLRGRAVAVKRVPQQVATLADNEIRILRDCNHPNVIQYYYEDIKPDSVDIAMELCLASLADIIKHPSKFKDITFDHKHTLHQITSGLQHLHSLKIIHRDIKPQNILVSSARDEDGKNRMLISDFGLCRKLQVGQTSFAPTVFGEKAGGTAGWRAPEILRVDRSLALGGSAQKPATLTKKVDIFALGCLFYYCLTKGGHPYGEWPKTEVNIMSNRKSVEDLRHKKEGGFEAIDLIEKMLNIQAALRPEAASCLAHPFFWDTERRLKFLQEASDSFDSMRRKRPWKVPSALEADASKVVGRDWRPRLDKSFQETPGQTWGCDGHSVQDLLRALRNKMHHFDDLPEDLQKELDNVAGEKYLRYFTDRFPRLFWHIYTTVARSDLGKEPKFGSYFPSNEHHSGGARLLGGNSKSGKVASTNGVKGGRSEGR